MKVGSGSEAHVLYNEHLNSLKLPASCRAAWPISGEVVLVFQATEFSVLATMRTVAGKNEGAIRVVQLKRTGFDELWQVAMETKTEPERPINEVPPVLGLIEELDLRGSDPRGRTGIWEHPIHRSRRLEERVTRYHVEAVPSRISPHLNTTKLVSETQEIRPSWSYRQGPAPDPVTKIASKFGEGSKAGVNYRPPKK